MFERCHFSTNITAVLFYGNEGPKPTEMNLRISQSSFSLKSRDKNAKIFYLQNTLQVSWMLWKTEFQLNSYHTKSSDKNFTKNLDRIITIDNQQTFPGTISETQYASGNVYEMLCSFGIAIKIKFSLPNAIKSYFHFQPHHCRVLTVVGVTISLGKKPMFSIVQIQILQVCRNYRFQTKLCGLLRNPTICQICSGQRV